MVNKKKETGGRMAGGPFVQGGSTPNYITLAYSGVLRKGDKIRSCCFTHAFSGPTSGGNCYPYVLGGRLKRGQQEK